MTNYIEDYDDDDLVRQGDLISRVVNLDGGVTKRSWGLVITADCDIAQDKFNNHYSWLEIITAEEFLNKYWSTDNLRKAVEKNAKKCVEYLNSQIKKNHSELSELTTESLCEWLRNSSPSDILSCIGCKTSGEFFEKLTGLKIAYYNSNYKSAIKKYKEVYLKFGGSEKNFMSSLHQALEGSDGFPDYFFLPKIHVKNNDFGFVILFRKISTLKFSELYKNEIDARIDGNKNAFYRVGRLSNSLRFSISQKIAFLFSRIGMDVDFENECSSAIKLSIQRIFVEQEAK